MRSFAQILTNTSIVHLLFTFAYTLTKDFILIGMWKNDFKISQHIIPFLLELKLYKNE